MRWENLTHSLGALVAAVALVSFPVAAWATISGSAHDFSGETWTTNSEICVVCHTPHDATVINAAPLWNHATSTQTYNLYTSATMDATPGQPTGVSLLCLSCHDGTVAIDSYGGNTGSTSISGIFNKGTDLSNDHPISVDYSADSGMNPDTDAVLGGTIASEMLFSGDVECASCHDVHNDNDNPYLLVIANTNSDLCLTCHNK